ncbi:diguanylate cyclase domain-containing protein [Prosthecomicrobium hirschii]|uniref:diguanylate cyclase domain-containing protein n=1 Tax=Prosthecodimorpha hirschii TaxID=665126 RepID=UPI00128FB0B8|nr:diguanylate cyclase [Prosthecomicrobium hirschii]
MSVWSALLANLAILALSACAWAQIEPMLSKLSLNLRYVTLGFHFSIAALSAEAFALQIEEGIYLGLRTSFVVLATLFGGILSGGIVAVAEIIQRFLGGGVGASAGAISIVATYIISCIFAYKFGKRYSISALVTISFLTAAVGQVVAILIIPSVMYLHMQAAIKLFCLTSLSNAVFGIILLQSAKRKELEDANEKYRTDIQALEQRWSFALDSARQGVWDIDLAKGKTYYSPIWKSLIGYGPNELTDADDLWLTLMHLDDRAAVEAANQAHLAGQAPQFEAEFRMRHKDGHWVWIRDRGRVVERGPDGTPLRMIGTHADVTERRLAEERIRVNEERFRSIFALSPVGMALVDVETQKFVLQSQSFAALLGIPPEAFAGLTFQDVLAQDQNAVAPFLQALTDDWRYGPHEMELADTSGQRISVIVTGSPLVDLVGQVQMLLVFQDITVRRNQEKMLWRLANIDPLTGLPNRLNFNKTLSDAIERAKRSGKKVGLAIFDIDHFKLVNDTLGHDAGDGLLKAIAERISDVLTRTDSAARLGGDEFAVIFEGIGDAEELVGPLEGLARAIRLPLELSGDIRHFSSSIGTSIYPNDALDPEDLMKAADLALYKAKSLGRNRFIFFSPKLRESLLAREYAKREVLKALKSGLYHATFQPIVDRDGTTCEALAVELAFVHSDAGDLSKDHVESALKDNDVSIAAIGIILSEALALASRLEADGIRYGRLLVRVSSSQLRSSEFADELLLRLDEHHLEPSVLCLAINEDAISSRGADIAFKQMNRLHALGVTFILDQFGEGQASLAQLHQLPIFGVRIADGFVANLEGDGFNQAIVVGLLDLLHRLGLALIAGQIERPSQADFLTNVGCDWQHGNFLVPPLTAPEVVSALRNWGTMSVESSESQYYLI